MLNRRWFVLMLAFVLMAGALPARAMQASEATRMKDRILEKIAANEKLSQAEEAFWDAESRSHNSELDETGGPDAFGMVYSDSNEPDGPAYEWIDISATGASVDTMSDDDYAGPFDIGFTFPFYGNDWTQFYIGSNGFISFGEGSSSLGNQELPSDWTPNNLIAWFWDDLNPTETDVADTHVYFEAQNNGTNDYLVISFINYPEFFADADGYITAQVILYDDGRIKIQYQEVGASLDLDSSTSGIENSDGTVGLMYFYNDAALTTDSFNNVAVEFSQLPAESSVSGTITNSVTGDPVEGALVELGFMSATTDANGLYNIPELFPGTYPVEVSSEGYLPTVDTVEVVTGANTFDFTIDGFPTPVLTDDFEAGGDRWTVTSTTPDAPLWQYGTPTVEPDAAHSGSFLYDIALDADYVNNAADTLTFNEQFTILEGCQLTYWQWLDTETGWDGYNVQLSTDNGTTWEIVNPAEPAGYPDDSIWGLDSEPGFTGHFGVWERVRFDLSAYVNETCRIRFVFGSDGSVSGYPGVAIDDFSLFGVGSMAQITGVVSRASDGTTLQNAHVTLIDDATGDVLQSTWTNADGQYLVRALPGDVDVRAIYPGLAPQQFGPFTVDFGDIITQDFSLVEETNTAVVSGTVTDEDGNPVEGANVRMYAGDVDVTFVTDANGQYTSGTDTYLLGEYNFAVNAGTETNGYHNATFYEELIADSAIDFTLIDILPPQNVQAIGGESQVRLFWQEPLNQVSMPTLTAMAQHRRDQIEIAEANRRGAQEDVKIATMRAELARIEHAIAFHMQGSDELDDISDFVGYRYMMDGTLQEAVVTDTTVTIPDLENGTDYTFSVAADYGYGEDALVWSDTLTVQPHGVMAYEPNYPFEWVDIIADGTGTALGFSDDSESEMISMGDMTMMHYGVEYNQFLVGANGAISYLPDTQISFISDPIPDTGEPNALVAVDWEDLDPGDQAGEDAYYYVDEDNRRVIVQWHTSVFPGNSDGPNNLHDFEVIMYPDEGYYVFSYLSAETWNSDGDAVIGIENEDGTTGFAVDTEVLGDNVSVLIGFNELVYGHVTGFARECSEEGVAVGDADVMIGTRRIGSTEADGSFSLDIVPGDYMFWLRHDDYYPSDQVAITVTENDTIDLGAQILTAPAINLGTSTLVFDYPLSQATPISQDVEFTNVGCDTMEFSARLQMLGQGGEVVGSYPLNTGEAAGPVATAPAMRLPKGPRATSSSELDEMWSSLLHLDANSVVGSPDVSAAEVIGTSIFVMNSASPVTLWEVDFDGNLVSTTTIPTGGVAFPNELAYDASSGMLMTIGDDQHLYRFSVDGATVEDLGNVGHDARGIAFDDVNGIVYWSDPQYTLSWGSYNLSTQSSNPLFTPTQGAPYALAYVPDDVEGFTVWGVFSESETQGPSSVYRYNPSTGFWSEESGQIYTDGLHAAVSFEGTRDYTDNFDFVTVGWSEGTSSLDIWEGVPAQMWMSLDPGAGVVEAGGTGTITVTINPALDDTFNPESGDVFNAQVIISAPHMQSTSVFLEINFYTSVDEEAAEGMPTKFALHQNYPNPFNPSTDIKFDLVSAQKVKLAVYNMLGQEVTRLVDGEMQAGYHQVTFDASHLASGVYFYRIETPAFTSMKKMVLVK